MSERAAIWRAAAEAARCGEPAALVTVARQRGSLPMASDAKMLVTRGGERHGTVGGGCLEADVTAQAFEAIGRGEPTVVRHTLNADVAGDLGLSCGGTVDLFVEPLIATDGLPDLLIAVADAITSRHAALVTTAIAWPNGPRKALVSGDRSMCVGESQRLIDARPADHAYMDEAAGVFVEPVPRTPRLLVFGAGHVGCEIARAAASTDFHVVVIDDREEFANRDRLPWSDEIIVSDHRVVLDHLTLDADDYVIACTRGHAMDALIIERTAASPARYVGMLGSQRKRAVIWKALERAGTAPEALARVKVPIGDPIGADTPGEIGIAVLAELIRLRRLPPQPRQQGA
ncbi:MAG TPA: XdhC family protein [Gemmatimonadales bacterium]